MAVKPLCQAWPGKRGKHARGLDLRCLVYVLLGAFVCVYVYVSTRLPLTAIVWEFGKCSSDFVA